MLYIMNCMLFYSINSTRVDSLALLWLVLTQTGVIIRHWGGRLGTVWNMCFSTTTEAEWSKAVRSWQGSSQLFSFQVNSMTFHYYNDGHVAGLQRTAKSSHRHSRHVIPQSDSNRQPLESGADCQFYQLRCIKRSTIQSLMQQFCLT